MLQLQTVFKLIMINMKKLIQGFILFVGIISVFSTYTLPYAYAEGENTEEVESMAEATEGSAEDNEETVEDSDSQETKEPVQLYLFYSNTCPHCADEKEFLDQFKEENPGKVEVNLLEISTSLTNSKVMSEVGKELQANVQGVPFTVIGNEHISGFGTAETTGKKIEELINQCYEEQCEDIVKPIIERVEAEDNSNSPWSTPLLIVGGILLIGILLVVFVGTLE
jgi:thiol-disulfide isomerase/thioredoxin